MLNQKNYIQQQHFNIQLTMSQLIQFESEAQVQSYASKNRKVLVILDQKILDVTSFAAHHPGGEGLIVKYRSKNINEQMKSHYPLSLIMANSMAVGSFRRQVEQVIKPDKPLLTQIWNLNHEEYIKIVDSPHWLFVQTPRMFQNGFFQMFSTAKWYYIFPIPLILTISLIYYNDFQFHYNKILLYAIWMIFGMLGFSLTEYLLHRFVFHSQKYLLDNKVLRYLHFIIHGIHHMLPFDGSRLVLPPALLAIIVFIGYHTVYKMINFNDNLIKLCFWIGYGIWYCVYDISHYFLHHYKAKKGSYFGNLQAYHNKHHFSGQFAGFGVSSKLWDIIFRTELSKQKNH